MYNIYGQFDMRSMSGVTSKSLRRDSAIASSPTQSHHRDTARGNSAATSAEASRNSALTTDAGDFQAKLDAARKKAGFA